MVPLNHGRFPPQVYLSVWPFMSFSLCPYALLLVIFCNYDSPIMIAVFLLYSVVLYLGLTISPQMSPVFPFTHARGFDFAALVRVDPPRPPRMFSPIVYDRKRKQLISFHPRELPPVHRRPHLLLSRFLRKHRLDVHQRRYGTDEEPTRTAKRSVSTFSHAHPDSLATSKNAKSRSARCGL